MHYFCCPVHLNTSLSGWIASRFGDNIQKTLGATKDAKKKTHKLNGRVVRRHSSITLVRGEKTQVRT